MPGNETYLAEAAKVDLTGPNVTYVVIVAVIALIALAASFALVRVVLAAPQGTPKMQTIAAGVQEGASAFLNRQFRTLAIFGVLALVLLSLLPADTVGIRIGRSVFFLVGAVFSGIIAYAGMGMATRANLRVAAAARDGAKGSATAMGIAFKTGGVVGFMTVGLGLLGASLVVFIFQGEAPKVLEGFGFGAALLAMFIRVGGGIFTKAADVGADLVGKVEQGIPEDDPRNAATIADNVGDNVGDCAGMAADLFESYAVTLVAALILGGAAFGSAGLVFPLIVPGIGVITAILGVLITRLRPSDKSGMTAINRAFFISAAVSAVLCAIAVFLYLPSKVSALPGIAAEVASQSGNLNPQVIALGAVLIGIVLAVVIQQLTGYFTEVGGKPVTEVGKTSLTGPATVVLSGFTLGLESAVYTAVIIGIAVFGAFILGGGSIILGLFAISLAGCGLLTTVGVIVAMDTFGPISDNAQGIAEMSGDIDEAGARVLTDLDAVGNTTKAITKGIAIATAVLAATALFGAFSDEVKAAVPAGALNGLDEAAKYAYEGVLNVANPANLIGLIIGAAVVFLFSGLAINAVTRAAGAIVFEVRRQFKEIPGIMEGTTRPEYGKVVDICTKDSLRELATPGLLAVMAPIAVGFGLGVGALGAYLAGAIATGVLMAILLANSGGAWDNAKKMVEDGEFGGKGTDAHAATVIGDTVGDPFKDTAGPSINPLIKVMNLVSLLIAPAIVYFSLGAGDNPAVRYSIAAVAVIVIIAAVWVSKRRATSVGGDTPSNSEKATAGNAA
ncbi:sodium-translocating pyrophosphatase [Fodinicola acaciae]|uniref:sodium-translocating pyrophosphatase n=1 Tax=Fodinicola acaciae TaxID=2681555 RepID=UPI0013D5084E|nr:sodium-translocating pyrophosphatase [Fodinicola acaciae]